jgi:hypothetical protein
MSWFTDLRDKVVNSYVQKNNPAVAANPTTLPPATTLTSTGTGVVSSITSSSMFLPLILIAGLVAIYLVMKK